MILKDIRLITSYITLNLISINYDDIDIFWKKILKYIDLILHRIIFFSNGRIYYRYNT